MKRLIPPRGRTFAWTVCVVAVSPIFVMVGTRRGAAEEKPFGLERREVWSTARLVGSPDPPPPYTVEKAFTNIAWRAPIYITAEPGGDSLFVVHQSGEQDRPAQVLRIRDDPEASETQTVLEMSGRLIYAVAFHPQYLENGYLFVFSNGAIGETEKGNRVSRFTVGRNAPFACDPATEHVIIEWVSGGHDGGDLVFGNDGFLYITSGDGTSDSDTLVTGQDASDLLGGVLRIDVEHPDEGRAYSIPADNPLVGVEGARPELWAIGLRNPWRMCVDRPSGQIWVGQNGQDLWETAHLLRRGENYGWSVYEGSHPFYLNRPRGPLPIVPPTIEHHHSEFLSLTGGVVYRGEKHSELDGVYVYGDHTTGRIWGGRHDGERLTWHRELADTTLQITALGVSHRGELLVADYGSGIYRIVPSPPEVDQPPFPTRLSETGLFRSTRDHEVETGVISYSVNAPGWHDGADADRYLAVPGDARIEYTSSGGWNFPDGSVLMQTLSVRPARRAGPEGGTRATIERESGVAPGPFRRNGPTRIETRLLLRQKGQWAAYSYRWNDEQTDAFLVAAGGEETKPAGPVEQTWQFPSRAQCLACHSRAANFVLGLSEFQMNRDHNYGGVVDNQLRTLEHIDLFNGGPSQPHTELPKLADPYDSSQDVAVRARSYLHVNCSVCHVGAGGGNAKLELGFTTESDKMELIGKRPQHDTFGIDNAMLVAPGDAARSILVHRIGRRGRGQMPPLFTSVVDETAVRLLSDWIESIEPQRKFVRAWTMEDLLPHVGALGAGRSLEAGKAAFRDAGCAECHRMTGEGGSVGPDLTGAAKRLGMRDLITSLIAPSEKVATEYAATVIVTTNGQSLVGRIEREDASAILLRPQSSAESITIAQSDIESRSLSTISNMPTGTLNTLDLEEILDLLAYLAKDGR